MVNTIRQQLFAVVSLVALVGTVTAVDLGAPCKCHETSQACNNKNQVLTCSGVENGVWEFDDHAVQCAGDETCMETFYRVFDFQEPVPGRPAEQLRAFCASNNPGTPPSIECDPNTMSVVQCYL